MQASDRQRYQPSHEDLTDLPDSLEPNDLVDIVAEPEIEHEITVLPLPSFSDLEGLAETDKGTNHGTGEHGNLAAGIDLDSLAAEDMVTVVGGDLQELPPLPLALFESRIRKVSFEDGLDTRREQGDVERAYSDFKEEEGILSTLSSPLSDLPDLPIELPTNLPPQGPVRKPFLPKNRQSVPPSGLPAESSTTARQAFPSAASSGPKGLKRGRPAKDSARKKIQATMRDAGAGLESEKDEDALVLLRDLEGGRDEFEEGKRKKSKLGRNRPVSQSQQRIDAAIGVSRDGDILPGNIAPRGKVINDTMLKKLLQGKEREVQFGSCLRPRYAPWGKCIQCVAKVGGDSCRFREFRVFKIDPNTAEILGPGWFESTTWKEAMTTLPKDFNATLRSEHILRIERAAATFLLPFVTRELRHVVNSKAIKREVDSAKHRSVCDFCSGTIFSGYFLCKKCGRDYCLQCERYFSDSMEGIRKSPWHLPDAARPRLLRCTGLTFGNSTNQLISALPLPPVNGDAGSPRPCISQTSSAPPHPQLSRANRAPVFHFRPDLQPVSRYDEAQLREHWLALAEFVLDADRPVEEQLRLLGLHDAENELSKHLLDWATRRRENALPGQLKASAGLTEEQVSALYTTSTNSSATPIPDPADLRSESHPFIFTSIDQLTTAVFDKLWAKGEPIVVDQVGARLKKAWNPVAFVERFGRESCYVVDCQGDFSSPMTVEKFFEMFNKPEGRGSAVLKLKDWPATDDFRDFCPELYHDFCDALPAPDFTRREGVLNLYSHFPPGPTRPDIGPKMYNAFAAVEDSGGQGSTRLHMDVADAVNVMLYASPRPDGQPGCAVWDVFRAEDADKIRAFLKRQYDATDKFTDPIHSQLFYLDSRLRRQLYEQEDVTSFRVYQYPGQAVFIPAGCAHQVCNLADCIKIALDFVSPHNVSRCQRLTQDFRTENFVKAWKEDVLQLYNVLWYAWLNCREVRESRKQEALDRGAQEASRAARLESLRNGDIDEVRDAEPSLSGRPIWASPMVISPFTSSVREQRAYYWGMSGYIPGGASERSTSVAPTSFAGIPPLDSKAATPPVQTITLPQTEQVEHPPEVPDERSALRRNLAKHLLKATLKRLEPPPPPEARQPSAATKWTPRYSSEVFGFGKKLHGAQAVPPGRHSGRRGGPKVTDLIREGLLPMDVALSTAKREMGEGGGEVGDTLKEMAIRPSDDDLLGTRVGL